MRLFALLLSISLLAISQGAPQDTTPSIDEATEPAPTCDLLCPSTDIAGNILLNSHSDHPPHDSFYSTFDCVYAVRREEVADKCHYYKDTGAVALSYIGSSCTPEAHRSCGVNPTYPQKATAERPPWVARGFDMMWAMGYIS